MNNPSNRLRPANPEALADFRTWLEKDPEWRRMKELHAKESSDGLSSEEREELRRIVEPKFRDGDVIQEFMRDLEGAKAKGDGNDAK